MAITTSQTGAVAIEGDESIKYYRMLTIRMGLKLELSGMRMCRGRTCYSIAKSEFGLKGSKARVYAAFCALCEAQSAKVIRVVEAPALEGVR